ncbi:hypothetical protein [Aurantimonas sp. VKM B-3413]|uniref:hypothetical protein n=1 Tax=Aurantimonas sp. VKM B-3413 TaxID=2779401 RepID=UPI001E3BFAB2|nr:hypothetical protein [Aurantimonas sp. VKM B-3413]MCB8837066.1 hypothetical protein [Aurantimonas sp. VKM B-3413]
MSRNLLAAFVCLLLPPMMASSAHSAEPACAAGLSANARMIFDAVVAAPSKASLKDRVTSKTKSLVLSGRLSRSQARPAAVEAGTCLKSAGL